MKDFLEQDFWRYSVKLYSKKAVEQACLLLQDEHGLNVNIVLYCLYHAVNNRGLISTHEFESLASHIDAFHKKITHQLRHVRTLWKKRRKSLSSTLIYQELFHIELAAEQIEQAIITETMLPIAQRNRSEKEKLNDCLVSLNNYFEQKKIKLNTHTRHAVNTLIQYAFPKNILSELSHVP